MGLFKDYDDIRNSPQQTNWGKVQPGDIKYKDVNGDGIINGSDEVAIGATTKPNLIYGLVFLHSGKASTSMHTSKEQASLRSSLMALPYMPLMVVSGEMS